MIVLLRLKLASWLLGFALVSIPVSSAAQPDEWLNQRFAEAKSEGCFGKINVFQRVFCNQQFRVGVRVNYPGFGMRTGDGFSGYDVAVAFALGRRLGFDVRIFEVNPATRIQRVNSGFVDVIIATMAHTKTREREVNIIRPAYYSAPAVIYGLKTVRINNDNDISGRQVCTTIGHFSNLRLAQSKARVTLYDSTSKITNALMSGLCPTAMQDLTFFEWVSRSPDFRARFEEKFRWDTTPWGIGVEQKQGEEWGKVLSYALAKLHASGELAIIAEQNEISRMYLDQQTVIWKSENCWKEDGSAAPECMDEPFDDEIIN